MGYAEDVYVRPTLSLLGNVVDHLAGINVRAWLEYPGVINVYIGEYRLSWEGTSTVVDVFTDDGDLVMFLDLVTDAFHSENAALFWLDWCSATRGNFWERGPRAAVALLLDAFHTVVTRCKSEGMDTSNATVNSRSVDGE